MEDVQAITDRARELISVGNSEIESAINKAVDEAFEAGYKLDESKIVDKVKASLVGLGVLDDLVNDPTVEEVWLNSPDSVFVAYGSISKKTRCKVFRVAGSAGSRENAS